jgi:hypothetical protein
MAMTIGLLFVLLLGHPSAHFGGRTSRVFYPLSQKLSTARRQPGLIAPQTFMKRRFFMKRRCPDLGWTTCGSKESAFSFADLSSRT